MPSQDATINSLDSLKEAFSNVIGLAGSSDWQSVRYGTTDGWDSMAHMQLVAELETKFDVMLSTEQVIGLSTFEKARETLEAHGIRFEP